MLARPGFAGQQDAGRAIAEQAAIQQFIGLGHRARPQHIVNADVHGLLGDWVEGRIATIARRHMGKLLFAGAIFRHVRAHHRRIEARISAADGCLPIDIRGQGKELVGGA